MQSKIAVLTEQPNVMFIVSEKGEILQRVTTEELPDKYTVHRGRVLYLCNKRYWLFYDSNDQCWLMGDDIEPLLINEEVTQTLEGYGKKSVQRKLTIYRNGSIYLQCEYALDPKIIFNPDNEFDMYYHPDNFTDGASLFNCLERKFHIYEAWHVKKD